MAELVKIFNQNHWRMMRDRAATSFEAYDFMKQKAAEILADRMADIQRPFERVLDYGCHTGQLSKVLDNIPAVFQLDNSFSMISNAQGMRVLSDPERLPFVLHSMDAVVSALYLHWVNDLPGVLVQLRQLLKPDGLLLACMFGGETLTELRQTVATVAAEQGSAMTPRVAPMVDIRDAGSLLQRTGYALPVVDSERVMVTYPDAWALMRDLRGMAETNILEQRSPSFSLRAYMEALAETYHRLFALEDGRIPATFDLITLTAWTPHASQQKPLPRGSGTISFSDALR